MRWNPQLVYLIGVVPLLGASPALAGSVTAGSIISKQDAIATASSFVPAGHPITAVNCTTMIRDLSARYRCTVHWSDAQGSGDR